MRGAWPAASAPVRAAGVALALLGASAPLPARAAEEPRVGLDHLVVAVRDLEAAARTWRALGFTLKPGRFHANGIRNLHVKFTDGTEIELLTAPAGRDDLTREYREHLRAGDGPRFLALFAPEPRRVAAGVEPLGAEIGANGWPRFPGGHPLHSIFFASRNRSPTDRPAHFAHANGAHTLGAVWLAGPDLSRERELLVRLGAPVREDSTAPAAWQPAAWCEVLAGEVRLLGPGAVATPGRVVCGATVLVADLAATRRMLARGAPDEAGSGSGTGGAPAWREAGAGLVLPPEATHGLWLEFRERAPARRP